MKEGWEYKKLEEICTKGSSNISLNKIEDNNGEYPLYGASGFVKGIDFYHQTDSYIGIVKDGSGVGRVNIYPPMSSLVGTMQYIFPKNNCILSFLKYLLQGLHLEKFKTGAAIPHIYFKDYGKTNVLIPPLSEQQHIVEELDLLSSIIEKKKAQLKELDNLAQSIFYEMFGDPITDEKGWEVKKLGETFDVSSGGTPSTKKIEYWDKGTIPWIGSNMCQNQVIRENDGKFITEEGLEHSSAKLYKKGFVLVALVGATIGKVALLEFNTTTNQNIAGINVPSNSDFTSLFVFYLLQSLYVLFENIGGGKFKMANLSFVRSLPIITPPLPLQNLFASKIQSIEHQKALIKQSITEVETLFNSRMDYYFN